MMGLGVLLEPSGSQQNSVLKNDQLRFIIATQLQISALNNHITMLLYPEQSTMHLNFVSATKLHKLYPYNSSNAVTFYY
jgi:hypothetical protein